MIFKWWVSSGYQPLKVGPKYQQIPFSAQTTLSCILASKAPEKSQSETVEKG
jgi:hypothetical protein